MDKSSIESLPKWFWPLVASLSVIIILLSILILTTLNKHGRTPAIKSVEKIGNDNQKKLDPAAMKLTKRLKAEAAAAKEMQERKAKASLAWSEGKKIDPFKLALGQIGRVKAGIRVLQVIDEDRMLIYVESGRVHRWGRFGGGGGIAYSNYSPAEKSSPFLVCGLSTKGIVDDVHLHELPGVYEVTRTWQYSTAGGGTKTVFVLQRLDMTPVD